MTVYLASDHTGLALKNALGLAVSSLGHEAVDLGPSSLDAGDDYPDYVIPCATQVAGEAGSFGIVIGGSGHGEAMAANRVRGARAATFYGLRAALDSIESESTSGTDPYDIVRVARMHNDANILSIGARFVTEAEAVEAVRVFLLTDFSKEERHVRRLGKF